MQLFKPCKGSGKLRAENEFRVIVMKKSRKLTLGFGIVFTIIFVLYSIFIYKHGLGKRPCDQPYSEWISEDGQITFSIDENGAGIGNLTIDEETMEIYIAIGPAAEIHVYPLEVVEDNRITEMYIEYWIGDFWRDDKFTAKIVGTTYFNIGDKITFYRVNNDTEKSEKGD